MNALNTLIDQTQSYMIEANNDGDKDMAECYFEDWKDFSEISKLLKAGSINAAANRIVKMDTAPREEIVIAVAKDKGNDWVAENLGWEVA